MSFGLPYTGNLWPSVPMPSKLCSISSNFHKLVLELDLTVVVVAYIVSVDGGMNKHEHADDRLLKSVESVHALLAN